MARFRYQDQSLQSVIDSARKRKTIKTRDRYKITPAEESRLMGDIGMNSISRDWAVHPRFMDALIDRHRKGDAAMKRVVEDQLDDMNFHSEARALSQGKYREVLQANMKEHKDMGTKPTARYAAQYGLISG